MSIKFSIIIPCYNQAAYLTECFRSLIDQKYQNWEAIIVNDGSTDNTSNLINQFTLCDNRVKHIEKQNGGLSSARNAGIKQIAGDYAIFLDADDMLLPYCLYDIEMEIVKYPKNQWIQVGYRHVSEEGNRVFTIVTPSTSFVLLPDIFFNNIGPVHTNCISKKLISEIGYFDETLKSCEDWDYWMRSAVVENSVIIIEKPLVDYRMNNNSMSRDSFVLYNAMKTVLLRGKTFSKTIDLSNKGFDLEIKFQESLKKRLALCIGVSVLQNKIEASASLFKEETVKYNLQFNPIDFKLMSSYLTFRYKTNRDEVERILSEYKGLFIVFFRLIGYTNKITRKCIWAIFSKHYHLYYTRKFGVVGRIIHRLKFQLI